MCLCFIICDFNDDRSSLSWVRTSRHSSCFFSTVQLNKQLINLIRGTRNVPSNPFASLLFTLYFSGVLVPSMGRLRVLTKLTTETHQNIYSSSTNRCWTDNLIVFWNSDTHSPQGSVARKIILYPQHHFIKIWGVLPSLPGVFPEGPCSVSSTARLSSPSCRGGPSHRAEGRPPAPRPAGRGTPLRRHGAALRCPSPLPEEQEQQSINKSGQY